MKAFITFLFLLFVSFENLAQEYIILKVIDETTQKPVSYAMIQNRTNDLTVVCDEYGLGSIAITDSTLLRISAVSYEHYFHFIIKLSRVDTVKILLKQKTYQLKEVVVHPYPTRILFKKALADLDITDSGSVSANLFMVPNLKGYDEQLISYEEGRFLTIDLGSPITGLYNLLNKRERSKRKLQKLQWEDLQSVYIFKRYNKEYVKQLLDIKKIKELEAFMEFCKPDYELLLASTDYELACYVLDCYQSFLLNHKGSE
jgi:hypothetical protein